MSFEDDLLVRIQEKAGALSLAWNYPLLGISISRQSCTFFKINLSRKTYPISTSKNQPSCRENSFGTPTGLHRISHKIGESQPVGMVFKGRVPTGETYEEMAPEAMGNNLITTRILRLEGMEPGLNRGPGVDSYDRFIYLHGTNHEERIGQPFSGGCIEFRNADILELFNQVPVGTLVHIE